MRTVFRRTTLAAILVITALSIATTPAQQLNWAVQAGGGQYTQGEAIAVDASGQSYVLGRFWDTVTFNSGASLTSAGFDDLLVARLDADGNTIWARRIGSQFSDAVGGIAIASDGGIYVVGSFWSPITLGAGEPNEITLSANGPNNAFIAKYDSNGTFLWVRRVAASGLVIARAMALDASDNIVVTGDFRGTTEFGDDGPSISATSSGETDLFVAKFDPSGTLSWVTTGGGSYQENGYGIAVAANGDVQVTGTFGTTATFAPGQPNETAITSSGGGDIFVASLAADGTLDWVRQAGGAGHETGAGVAIDASGNSYITGHFEETIIFGAATPTETALTSDGWDDMFVAKYDAAGTMLWARRGGGSRGIDQGNAITIDAAGRINVVGYFNSDATFSPANDNNITLSRFGVHTLLAAYDANGLLLQVHNPGPSLGQEVPVAAGADALGHVFVAGTFNESALFGPGVTLTAAPGTGEMFVAKFEFDANTAPSFTPAPISGQAGSPGGSITLGTASDAETAAADLTATIDNVYPFLTFGPLVNNSGTITSTMKVECWAPIGTLPPLSVTVSDGEKTSTAAVAVTIDPNQPPSMGVYPPTTVAAGGSVTVTPSFPISDNGTIQNVQVSAVGFTGTRSVDSAGVVTIGNAGPVGTRTISVIAFDNCNQIAVRSFALTITNPAPPPPPPPPVITSMVPSPASLWPPNHKMVDVNVAVVATDHNGQPASCLVNTVTSNEPSLGEPDWQLSGGLNLKLRAEREGTGQGRVYTVGVTCSDSGGLTTTGSVEVRVPKSQGQ